MTKDISEMEKIIKDYHEKQCNVFENLGNIDEDAVDQNWAKKKQNLNSPITRKNESLV